MFIDILVTTPNRLVYLLQQEPAGISLKKYLDRNIT